MDGRGDVPRLADVNSRDLQNTVDDLATITSLTKTSGGTLPYPHFCSP